MSKKKILVTAWSELKKKMPLPEDKDTK